MKKLLLMLMLMAPLATFAQKFGKVNTQTIMQNELKRQSDAYDKAKSTMNPTAQKQKEEELNTLYQKIQQTYSDNQQALQKAQQDKMQPVVEKVRKAIENVGKAGGFTYIFEEGAAVYTGTNVEDVTAKVQAEINKMK